MNKYNLKLFAFVDFKSVQFDGFGKKGTFPQMSTHKSGVED